ncbi:MAG TPA: RDD family protein [Gammaproteobacteria bacterium]|nr:RDD family protein [Gammaproteobacteria bacterium]
MNTLHSPQSITENAALAAPGLLRRWASGLYDALIVLAICILATFLLMPFTHSRALDTFYAHSGGLKTSYQLGLLILGYAFFGGFWTHGGQTIGMRTWKLRVVRLDGARLDWYRALLRYLGMLIPWLLLLLGSELLITAVQSAQALAWRAAGALALLAALAAFLWPAFDRRRLAWHDRLSGTRLVLTDKAGNAPFA